MTLGFNLRNWTVGFGWDDEDIVFCLFCFGVTFTRPRWLGGVGGW